MKQIGRYGDQQKHAWTRGFRMASVASVTALCVLAWPSIGFSQSAQSKGVSETVKRRDNAKIRLDSTRQNLKKNRARAETIQEELVRLRKERAALNADLISTSEKVQKTEARMTSIEARLETYEAKERKLRTSLNSQHRSIGRLLAAIQRMGRNPPPVMITRRSDALAMVRSAMLLARAFPTLRGEAMVLSRQLNKLVALMNGIRKESEALRKEADNLKAAQVRLASLMRTKRQSLSHRRAELVEVQRTVKVIGGNVRSLEDLIRKLGPAIAKETRIGRQIEAAARRKALAKAAPDAKSLSEKQAAALRAKKLNELQVALNVPKITIPPSSVPKSPIDPVVVRPPKGNEIEATPSIDLTPKGGAYIGDNARLTPAIPFHRAKGRLPMPAAGAMETRFGEPTKFGGRSKGLVIKTRYGAQITSPTDGLIVYAGKFRTYKQLLIIKAGNGYHVLLAGMSRIDVQSGQFVLASEPVGTMKRALGDRSDQNSPRLYVEFRKDGRPINPRPWWSANLRTRVQG
jgi:murein hydrolase activator